MHLAFTHFGVTNDAHNHLEHYERQLVRWFDEIRQMKKSLAPGDIVNQILNRPCYVSLPEVERSAIAMCVRGAILSLEADSA